MGFEPTDGNLGSYCLTTWRHPQWMYYSQKFKPVQPNQDWRGSFVVFFTRGYKTIEKKSMI